MASWPQIGVPIGPAAVDRHGQADERRGRATASTPGAGGCPSSLSIVLVGVGLYVRLRVRGEPGVRRGRSSRRRSSSSRCSQVIKEQPREILTSALRPHVRAGAVLPVRHVRAHLRHRAPRARPRTTLLNDTLVAAAIGLVSVPFFGYLSDLIGRRLMYGIGIVCIGALRLPLLRPAQHQDRRADAAGHRAVAGLPRHAVRPAGRADRRELRHRTCATAAPGSATSSPR